MDRQNLIIFDGLCNFCSRCVQFIIKRDRGVIFKFSPMQSEFAQQRLLEQGLNPPDLDGIVLIKGGRAYTGSDAGIEIAKAFSSPWKFLAVVGLIPRPIRNKAYSVLVKNRYRLFGKKETCMVPTEDVRSRFIM